MGCASKGNHYPDTSQVYPGLTSNYTNHSPIGNTILTGSHEPADIEHMKAEQGRILFHNLETNFCNDAELNNIIFLYHCTLILNIN